jgi:hypothetical protein
MPHPETEWSLQRRLTRDWLQDKQAVLGGEELFLAAWEVMADFRINDSRRHWSLPSIDFVFLDRAGRMLLLELKRKVTTPRDSWAVVCQVTHRAHALSARYSQALLESAYQDCHSGADGRSSGSVAFENLLEAHASAFNQPILSALPGRPVRRLIMAQEFGPAFAKILSAANEQPRAQVVAALERYKPRGEIKRYLDLPVDPLFVDPDPIRAVTIDGQTWRAALNRH